MNAYELSKLMLDVTDCESSEYYQAGIMLRQQADKIAKYEQALQAIANDYHELSDHKIEVQNRNHKKWAREALE